MLTEITSTIHDTITEYVDICKMRVHITKEEMIAFCNKLNYII